ncbi:hypothetical protein [Psychroserpens algicola]|uniref:hypothetical protein n=1 Tax=Psychroserpens algicola TaxID=1719034 RepID=UPI001953DAE4|nr:hypothetical protein [Psychroserpens algicola]
MTLNYVTRQNLNGKWLLKQIDSGNGEKGYPGFQLLEIESDCVDIYMDISLEKKVASFLMRNGNLLNSNNENTSEYKIVNENHLKLYVDGTSNDENAIFECDFFRLEPTITSLKKDDIEKMIFVNSETEFVFNKELWDKESLELHKITKGERKMIEQIDSTLFLSTYFNGKKHSSFPIKEVTTEFIKICGIPKMPKGIIGYRKE